MLNDWIYNTPPWLSSSVMVLAGIVLSGLLLIAVRWLLSEEERHSHNEFTMFTVTNMAVFYAVLLAFIAIAAWENLEKASDAVEKEAVLAESLYLDTQGLDDKSAVDELRNELRNYVETVINREWPRQQAGHVSEAADPYLRRIRATLATFKPETSRDAILVQEMLHGLNDLFDTYHGRLEAAGGHIPSSIWWVIAFLGTLCIGFTAFLGMRSLKVHFILLAGFTTTIVIVATLIVQLDYPFRGRISVSDEPFEHLLAELAAPQDATAGTAK
jgi:amino acid transporter